MSKPDIHDAEYVRELFDRVSNTYGYTNYFASFGFTERWRKTCLANLGNLKLNASGYDLMCGRGETWTTLFAKHPTIQSLTGIDISPEMIKGARTQAEKINLEKFSFMKIDVFDNQIPDISSDFVISTFGLKTLTLEQQQALAIEVERILKPGGVYSFVEVSYPKDWIFSGLYIFYLKKSNANN